jgi:hypothetical protein
MTGNLYNKEDPFIMFSNQTIEIAAPDVWGTKYLNDRRSYYTMKIEE